MSRRNRTRNLRLDDKSQRIVRHPDKLIADEMGTALYVAYGMNTNRKQMANRCPLAVDLGRVTLPGRRLVMRGVADVVPMRSRNVECVLWKITPDCERALDSLEGYPFAYVKERVKVFTVDGTALDAFIYSMPADRRPSRRSESPAGVFYYEMLETGYKEHGIDVQQLVCAQMEANGFAAQREAEMRQEMRRRFATKTKSTRSAREYFAFDDEDDDALDHSSSYVIEPTEDDFPFETDVADECRVCERPLQSQDAEGYCIDCVPRYAIR